VVTTCGNIASPDLPINVYPFILRGVTVVVIDAQNCPMAIRQKARNKLSKEWQIRKMETVVEEVTLDELDHRIDKMLARGSRGRAIVNMQS